MSDNGGLRAAPLTRPRAGHAHALTIQLPESTGGRIYALRAQAFAARPGPLNRVALAAAHVVADPLADIDPWLAGGARLGPHHRLPRASLEPRPRRRRGHGYRPARHGPRLADGAGADQALGRGGARPHRRGRVLRRRHRSSRPGRGPLARRRDPRLRGADRGDRGGRRPHHPDGLARAGAGRRSRPTTTPASTAACWARCRSPSSSTGWATCSTRRSPATGARAISTPAMATAVDVINASAAKVDGVKISLLDKDKEIAMRRRLAKRRAHVYGRRLQLRRADRGRRAGLFARAARHLRCHRARRLRGALGAGRQTTSRRSTPSWRRPCRCRGISSRRRRASTRPAWSSWPISTATRTISPWSAARRARAPRCISPSCSASPTRPACWPTRSRRRRACRRVLAVRGIEA